MRFAIPTWTEKNIWWGIYTAIAVLQLGSILLDWNQLRLVSKPLLMAVLLVMVLRIEKKGSIGKWLVASLTLALLGDVVLSLSPDSLLMEPNSEDPYFIPGLGLFMGAFGAYSFAFRALRIRNRVTGWSLWVLLLIAMYGVVVFYLLLPSIVGHEIVVILYILVLAIAFVQAWHAYERPLQYPGIVLILGILLFTASNIILAWFRFVNTFPGAPFLWMLTYILAQALMGHTLMREIEKT